MHIVQAGGRRSPGARAPCTGCARQRSVTAVRRDPRTIDVGVREVVAVLNRLPGVTTRASCQGTGPLHVGHRHGDLAYVLFRHQLPLALQEFFVAHLGPVGRVEDDGIYSRWPADNQMFLDRLTAAARAYVPAAAGGETRCLRRHLPKLRAWLAAQLLRGEDTRVALCLHCRDLVRLPHCEPHEQIALCHVSGDLETRWFADFVQRPGNAIDAGLVAADGWPALVARTRRGDFGTAFLRRWLRYRSARLNDLATRQLRAGVESARQGGMNVDFFYDDRDAVFTWSV